MPFTSENASGRLRPNRSNHRRNLLGRDRIGSARRHCVAIAKFLIHVHSDVSWPGRSIGLDILRSPYAVRRKKADAPPKFAIAMRSVAVGNPRFGQKALPNRGVESEMAISRPCRSSRARGLHSPRQKQSIGQIFRTPEIVRFRRKFAIGRFQPGHR